MGEHLDLISHLNTGGITTFLEHELRSHPRLLRQLTVEEHRVTTLLAIGNEVFHTFKDMVALYELVERSDALEYGSGHEYNATPAELLMTRSCCYLGPLEDRGGRAPRVLIPAEVNEDLEHLHVWRKTKRVRSRNGTWYHRKLRPDETSGVRGNPNGRREYCPNDDGAFTATKAGFAWDYTRNVGRDLYRCQPCVVVFNMGERATPAYAHLADALREVDREQRMRGVE